jgi:hypothetical protein
MQANRPHSAAMGTKSRESIYGSSIRVSAERAKEARKEADRLACVAWNQRMLGFKGPAQPSPALGDALNAGHICPGLVRGAIGFALGAFCSQRREEALHRLVIPDIAGTAHAADDAAAGHQALELLAGVDAVRGWTGRRRAVQAAFCGSCRVTISTSAYSLFPQDNGGYFREARLSRLKPHFFSADVRRKRLCRLNMACG